MSTMERIIKFRGKLTGETLPLGLNKGDWWTGFYYEDLHCGEWKSFIKCGELDLEVDKDTVGQVTGLLDKNGTEIYEGDIIFSQKCDCRAVLHKVEYNIDNAMFVAKPIQDWDFDFCQISKYWIEKYGKEVIGNIHDNPELLKTETL